MGSHVQIPPQVLSPGVRSVPEPCPSPKPPKVWDFTSIITLFGPLGPQAEASPTNNLDRKPSGCPKPQALQPPELPGSPHEDGIHLHPSRLNLLGQARGTSSHGLVLTRYGAAVGDQQREPQHPK